MCGYPHNFYGCLFVVCTSTLPLPLTTWTLLVIALERFIAIRWPFKHAQYCSRSRVIKLVVMFWSVGAGFIFLPMLGWNLGWINNGECSFHLLVDTQFRIFAIFVPSSLAPLLAMFCVVVKTTRAVGVGPQPAAPDAAPDDRRTALVAAKKCGVIILAYVVFIIPIDIVICTHYFLGYQCLLCVRVASWGILCHGFICPIIYLCQNKLLRNVVCLTLRRRRIDEHELSLAPVPDQGCAGPVAYIIRGAPSLRTCNICHFNGCKRNSGKQKHLSSFNKSSHMILFHYWRLCCHRVTWGKAVPLGETAILDMTDSR